MITSVVISIVLIASSNLDRIIDTSFWSSPNKYGSVNMHGQVYGHVFLGGDSIIIGGNFGIAGNTLSSGLSLWDGKKWSSSVGQVNGTVDFLAKDAKNGDLFIHGRFDQINGSPVTNFAIKKSGVWVGLEDTPNVDEISGICLSDSGNLWLSGPGRDPNYGSVTRIQEYAGGHWVTRKLLYGLPGVIPKTIDGKIWFILKGGQAFSYSQGVWDSIQYPENFTANDIFSDRKGNTYFLGADQLATGKKQSVWKLSNTKWEKLTTDLDFPFFTKCITDTSGDIFCLNPLILKDYGIAAVARSTAAWKNGKWNSFGLMEAHISWDKALGANAIDIDKKNRVWNFGGFSSTPDKPIWAGLAMMDSSRIWTEFGGHMADYTTSELHTHRTKSYGDSLFIFGNQSFATNLYGDTGSQLQFPDLGQLFAVIEVGRSLDAWTWNQGDLYKSSDTLWKWFARFTLGKNTAGPPTFIHSLDDGKRVLVTGPFDSIYVPLRKRKAAKIIAVISSDTIIPLNISLKSTAQFVPAGGIVYGNFAFIYEYKDTSRVIKCDLTKLSCAEFGSIPAGVAKIVFEPISNKIIALTFKLNGNPGYEPARTYATNGLTDTASLWPDSTTLNSIAWNTAIPDGNGGLIILVQEIGGKLLHATSTGKYVFMPAAMPGDGNPYVCEIGRTDSGNFYAIGRFDVLGGKVLPFMATCLKCLDPIDQSHTSTISKSVPKSLYSQRLRNKKFDLLGRPYTKPSTKNSIHLPFFEK